MDLRGPPGWKQLTVKHNHTQPETQSQVCNVPADQRKPRRSHSEVPTTGSKPRERRPVSEGCWRRTKAARPAGTRGGGCLRRGPGPEGRRPPGARAGGWRRQGCGEAGTAAELGEAGSSGDVAAGEAAPGRENRTHQGHFHRQGPEPRRHPHRLCWSDTHAGDPSSAPRRGRVFTYRAPPRRRQQGKGIWVL